MKGAGTLGLDGRGMGVEELVYGSFQNIIPQTVTVELPPNDVANKSYGDDWLLECLLNTFKNKLGPNLYHYKRQGQEPDSYMSIRTLCSNENVERKTLEPSIKKNLLRTNI